MALWNTPYDDVLYAVDLAGGRATLGDADGVAALVDGALSRLTRMPYPGLLREARLAGTDAVDSARLGDFERASEALALLRHVVEDANGLEYRTLLTA
jgi:hypothetical protein